MKVARMQSLAEFPILPLRRQVDKSGSLAATLATHRIAIAGTIVKLAAGCWPSLWMVVQFAGALAALGGKRPRRPNSLDAAPESGHGRLNLAGKVAHKLAQFGEFDWETH